MGDILLGLIGRIWSWFGGRRKLRVLVHKAFLLPTGPECFFINVTNISKSRDIEVTHIWLDTEPQVHVLRPERPLPKRLRPDETWETWVQVSEIPNAYIENTYYMVRVRLSNGKIIRSRMNKRVPSVGYIPGGRP
jgi:hypothetical protein